MRHFLNVKTLKLSPQWPVGVSTSTPQIRQSNPADRPRWSVARPTSPLDKTSVSREGRGIYSKHEKHFKLKKVLGNRHTVIDTHLFNYFVDR